jgi:hypothetical protein
MKYVGFDWASQAHDVTVLDSAGQVVDRWAFPHSEAGWVDDTRSAAATRTA